MNSNITILICTIFFHFKKKISSNISNYKSFLKDVDVLKYISSKLSSIKIKYFKSSIFDQFLDINYKFWKKQNIRETSEEIILVESFVNHQGYALSNAIIANYLKKIYGMKIICVIKKNNYEGKKIFQSCGINHLVYFKNPSFIKRIEIVFLALKLLKNCKTIHQFTKIKYLNADVGLSAYDAFIRYTGTPHLEKINMELIYFLTEALFSCDEFQNLLSNKKIKFCVQAETAFLPSNTLFQMCLKRKIKVFARLGVSDFALRIYDNFNQRYKYRDRISNKIFNEIYNNNKKLILKKYHETHNKKLKEGKFGIDIRVLNKSKNKPLISKSKLLKKFNWKNKKIGVVFMHHLIDKNYHSGPRKYFIDNYSWTKFIINSLIKAKNLNWIIKPHPTEAYYKSKKNLNAEIKKITEKYNHIKLFPDNYSQISLLQICDYAVSSNGSVGVEYPANNIPSIYIEESYFTGMSFLKKYKKDKKFLNYLNNLTFMKKIDNKTVLKSKVFMYARFNLFNCNCGLLSKHDISRNFDRESFWKNNIQLIKYFNIDKDELFKMLKLQLKYNLRHTINFNKVKIRKKLYNDLN